MGVVIPDMFEVPLEKGNIVLLCSDGLSNMLADSEILETVKEYDENLDRCAEVLIDRANKNGGKDNISVVLVRID